MWDPMLIDVAFHKPLDGSDKKDILTVRVEDKPTCPVEGI